MLGFLRSRRDGSGGKNCSTVDPGDVYWTNGPGSTQAASFAEGWGGKMVPAMKSKFVVMV
jgi:hypothetical protein